MLELFDLWLYSRDGLNNTRLSTRRLVKVPSGAIALAGEARSLKKLATGVSAEELEKIEREIEAGLASGAVQEATSPTPLVRAGCEGG